ncbi:hypothetical protein JCM33374_g1418 [Metschnikowia sp. JCM 33374]|nr:hypothetical protein JCM33374_g1418 [Metschnikowia sp. JCM 33374]
MTAEPINATVIDPTNPFSVPSKINHNPGLRSVHVMAIWSEDFHWMFLMAYEIPRNAISDRIMSSVKLARCLGSGFDDNILLVHHAGMYLSNKGTMSLRASPSKSNVSAASTVAMVLSLSVDERILVGLKSLMKCVKYALISDPFPSTCIV